MFEKILIPTDLSEASDHVIGCLHGLRPLGVKDAILVHALGIRHLEDMKYPLTRLAEPRLEVQKALLEKQGFRVKVVVALGVPSLEINRVASEERVSMIALGTHGATLAGGILLGSVAVHVLHSATVPVLVIRVKITTNGAGARCEAACADFTRPILYATDFSDTAERAFAYLGRMVESGARQVTLLHVQDKTRLAGHLEKQLVEFNRIDEERLQRLRHRLLELGATDVRIEVPYGSPINEIVRRTKEGDYSLIVMGSQGRGFIAETFLGSVSHNVVRQAPIPALLIPALR